MFKINKKKMREEIEQVKQEEIIQNKKKKMHELKKIGLIVILVLLAIVGLVYVAIESDKYTKDNVKFAQEYRNVDENNIFVYKSLSEIIKILENGTGIVYLGFPECPWCQAYVEYLNEVAIDNGIKKIYYCNILNDRKDNTKDYQKVVELLSDVLDFDDEGNKRVFVPDVTFIYKGKIVGHNNETSMISGGITPSDYWTNKEVSKLKVELRNYINEIKDDTCSSCNK